ncbi:putative serine/threonine-protein kinase SIS8 [Senna tora]|uniref:Putative serine/threonine-protein kinase SIS8 n=1 Tax=Senna tora TaxID=362788 RepID=A0A834TSI4_9FABA|nr:putative serine/threonine-protein kinase SIS8 [Senna tora]
MASSFCCYRLILGNVDLRRPRLNLQAVFGSIDSAFSYISSESSVQLTWKPLLMELNKPEILLVADTRRAPGMLAQHSRAESASGVLKTGQDVLNNISIQPGKDFFVEFGHDGIAGRRVPSAPDSLQKQDGGFGFHRENGQVKYEDLTNILGLKRMDSENPFDIADLTFAKEPAKEMENGAFVYKFSKNQKEDGNGTHGLRKALGESVGDQTEIGTPGSTFLRKESSYCNELSGLGVSDDSQSGKIKFLCSFGGKILPRPSDGKLRYVGGETRIMSIRKNISWEELVTKTLGICNQPHTIKYQLPGEDLDALISVSSDEDLQNMIEEYHGPERHEGSQRLRIFLIPLSESEMESSLEASTIQQSDPDYQYVVAVNGIGDRNPRIKIPGQSLTNEARPMGANLNFVTDFPNAPSASDIKDGGSALHPDGFFNDSQNLHGSSNQHPSISPNPFQGGNLSAVYMQSQGNNSCQGSVESSLSFITAQLPPESSSISTADHRYSQQMVATFLSDSNPSQQADVSLPEQHYGRHFRNYDPSKEFVTVSYANQSDGYNDENLGESFLHKDRSSHCGNPFSCLGESICPQSGYNGNADSLIGIPHAFSDSKLNESGARSGYCSQEGICLSSSLNLSKAQLSSMVVPSVRQSNPMVVQHDPSLIYPQPKSKILNVEPAELHRRQDLPFSAPSAEILGVNEPVLKDSVLYNKRDPLAKADLHVSSFVEQQCGDSAGTIEMMKIIEDKNSIQRNDRNLYEGKSPAIAMGNVNELHLPDSSASNFLVTTNKQKQWEQYSEDMLSASSGVMGISQNDPIEKTPSDFLDMSYRTHYEKQSGLAGGFNGELGFDFSLTRNSGLNGSFLNSEGNSCGKTFLGNHLFELPIDSVSHEYAQVQPSFQKDTGLHESPTVSSAYLYPPVLHNDPVPSSNLPMNDLQNSSKNVVFKRVPSLLDDDFIVSADQMVDQFIGGTTACETKVDKCDDSNKVEPLIIVEDVTGVVPPGIESSSVPTPHMVDEIGSDVVSPSATEVESSIPDSEPEDLKDNEEDMNESLTEAMIAEMEASIYGLQIIRNADLEELRELGSGTYGTVYHGKWRGTDVAIKRIKKSCFAGRSSEQERLAKDFWREAQILSNLHHPNVVAFYGVVPDGAGGTLATVTEFMVNGSLRHVLIKKDRLLDHRKKLIIAMDAAFGMEYLHSKNIVHFDLKCDNLLVNLRDPHRPICKVGDFGLSRIKRNTLVSGGVRGTLPWMAPELLSGSSSRVSEKVDVFSFGISMWELLTGEEPYADMHCGAIIEVCAFLRSTRGWFCGILCCCSVFWQASNSGFRHEKKTKELFSKLQIVFSASQGGIVKNTLRPPIPERCDSEWRKLMEECWSPDPDSRPSFTEITGRLRTMSKSLQAKEGHNQARQIRPGVHS